MSDRSKWLDQSYRPFRPTPVKVKPPSSQKKVVMDYSYHLMMLQERNRLLKKLNLREDKETELRKKEKGFSLYLNGANTAPPPPPSHRQLQHRPSDLRDMRYMKTAGGSGRLSPDREERSRTAPASKRKEWSHDTVVVRTQNGDSVPVTAPEIISGCYDDDFESSAAEMTDDDYIPETSGGEEETEEMDEERGGKEEEKEEEEKMWSSMEDTLTSDYQDSLVESSITEDIEGEEEGEEGGGGGGEGDEVEDDSCEPSAEPELHSSSTEKALSAITERVRELNLSGQRKLLQMLLHSPQTTPTVSQTTPIVSQTTSTVSETTPTTPDWFKRPITSPSPLPPPPLSSSLVNRPVSTRSTGLRGEMVNEVSITAQDNDEREHNNMVADRMRESPFFSATSGRTTNVGTTSVRTTSGRTTSGRTSGLRGQLLSRAHSDQSMSVSKEDGVRVMNELERLEKKIESSTSYPDLHCRPETAVIATTGSHFLSLPTIPTSSPLEKNEVLLTDTPCDSTHQPHPDILNDSLASIAYFDHTHLGQLNRTSPDEDLLRTFLSEHQQKIARETISCSGEEEEEEEGGERIVEEEIRGYSTPILPTGQQLIFNLLTTWGDQFYVGLTGLEIFTESGERASIAQIAADPSDINVLPEYTGDPRVVGNLLDGINRTKDDVHMWLAPFTPSHPHIITISFSTYTTIAMIRILNYNKSRIHSYRGVRDMEMWLDHTLIFRGEISRSSGGIMNQTTNCGETILFTTDKDILYRVGLHDNCYLESQPCCYGDGNPADERKEDDDSGRDREKNNSFLFSQP